MERILQRRYRVLRSLGRGGLGCVYLCDDLRLPGKQWALKQMHIPEEGLYERFRESFDREAATLSRLRHPNLPVIVDYFEEADGCYLVMEYVEGENLAEHVRHGGHMTELEAFRTGQVLVEMLRYLHSQDPPVIFRDLKPENVMLMPDGTLKLVDFGLARRFQPEKHSDTLPSGSVGYAAPEQWEDLSQTDERSDIYSWGATMVYLLSGKIPSPVFPLSALRTLETPLTERGAAIITRCLKSRPSERYAGAVALAQDVQGHAEALSAARALHAENPPVPQSGSASEVRRAKPAKPVPEGVVLAEGWEDAAPAELASVAAGRTTPSVTAPVSPPTRVPVETRRVDTSERPRRVDSRIEVGSITRPIPRNALRPLAGPLTLLVAATIMFLAALVGELPRARAVGSPVTPTVSGVGPYQLRYASNPDKEEGRRLYDKGSYTQAVALLDNATTRFPDDAEAHILKENAYIRLTGAPFVEIPFIGSMSGVDGPDSFSQLHGLALAQSTINARGGVHGRKVLIDLYDDQSSTSQCLQITEKLARDPRVRLVIGPYNSQRTIAVAPIVNAAHLPLVTPPASANKVWESGPYIFSAADSTEARVKAQVRDVMRSGYKRIGVVMDETSTISMEMLETAQKLVRGSGIEIVQLPSFQEDALEFAPQIAAIREKKPDIVFFSDYRAPTTAAFCRQVRDAGIETPIFSQTIPFTQALIALGGPAVNGLQLSAYFHPQLNTAPMRAFMAGFRRKFGDLTPTHLSIVTFDSLTAVAEALETCDTREQLAAYFRSSGNARPPFDGVAGKFALGKRLDARKVWVIEVTDGLYRLVDEPR